MFFVCNIFYFQSEKNDIRPDPSSSTTSFLKPSSWKGFHELGGVCEGERESEIKGLSKNSLVVLNVFFLLGLLRFFFGKSLKVALMLFENKNKLFLHVIERTYMYFFVLKKAIMFISLNLEMRL